MAATGIMWVAETGAAITGSTIRSIAVQRPTATGPLRTSSAARPAGIPWRTVRLMHARIKGGSRLDRWTAAQQVATQEPTVGMPATRALTVEIPAARIVAA